MTSETRTGAAWEALFADERLSLRRELNVRGFAFVSADDIRSIGHREPRLMAKLDTRESRPKILAKERITILPVANGLYALVVADGYCDIPRPPRTETFPTNELTDIVSLPWRGTLRSECQVLDTALISGMLAHFVGESSLHLTIRGALRAPAFEFEMETPCETFRGSVSGVQIEVDAGLEGDKLYLVEAKMGSAGNFIVRQLYYPYRMWQHELMGVKQVVPILLQYSNRTFAFYMYEFAQEEAYSSLRLRRSSAYTLDIPEAPVSLAECLARTTALGEPEKGRIPFPQADDLDKVIDVVDAAELGLANTAEIAEFFGFDPRQSDYYGNAAAYLGLLERRAEGGFSLTEQGRRFAGATRHKRLGMLLERMSARPVLRKALEALGARSSLGCEAVAALMADARPEIKSEATLLRRAGTVMAWMEWVQEALRPS